MRKILAAVFGLAVLATATPALAAASGHQRPCPPRNKHCRPVKPPVPPPTCTWVIGAAIGDVPHCV